MRSLKWVQSFIRSGIAILVVALVGTAALAVSTPGGAGVLGWPRQVDSSSGSIVIYEPQPESLDGDVVTGRAAFSLQRSEGTNPTFGVLWFTEQIEIDRDSSTVMARRFDVTKVRLPGITAAEAKRYEKTIEAEAADWDLSGSLEELQAGLAAAERERASVASLDHTPPRIVFASERAIMIAFDGVPFVEPIEGSKLERVVNTPYAVVRDPSRRAYYLNGANLWYTAKNPLGPWTSTHDVPSAVRAIVPPDTSADDQTEGAPPRVLTATEPTELISTDGPPRYASLVGDQLIYVTNTESDVVREVSSQELYVLLAGRWFRAPSTEGPWSFVRSDELPVSFRRIPADSPKGNILASVAGTDQAEDAVADAEIPQTSAIRRDDADFEASYDGSPQFEPIEGTDLEYAVNTDAQVILADGRYYACDQGVWYIADSPDGPWSVSDTRPVGVDDIPPSSPVYNTRYVYIYDTTPDVIYMGYLPGYVGCYPFDGTVVYGTGHRYKPWRGRHHYYPRLTTWGFHPRYNPWLSRWSFGVSYGTGFLRVGTRWRSWRQPSRRHTPISWFGPGGYRRPLVDRDRTLLRTRRPGRSRTALGGAPANLYNRPENVARLHRDALRMPIRRVGRPVETSTRLPNNVFAGKDGRVYQRDLRGKWKVNNGRSWKPAPVPATPTSPSPATADRGARSLPRPDERPALQPTPGTWPSEPPVQTRRIESPPAPPASAAPPAIQPRPGNLEDEFRARERARQAERPVVTPPPPPPAPPTTPTPPTRQVRSKLKATPEERKN